MYYTIKQRTVTDIIHIYYFDSNEPKDSFLILHTLDFHNRPMICYCSSWALDYKINRLLGGQWVLLSNDQQGSRNYLVLDFCKR
jgi:hypothetical protein